MNDYNAADRRQVAQARARAKLADKQDNEVITQIMATPAGRAWVYRFLEACHTFQNPFSADDRITAFNCGEMNIGQVRLLIPIMAACPDQYIQMMREEDVRRTATKQQRRPGTGRDDQGSGSGDGEEGSDPAAGAGEEVGREDV